MSAADWKPGDVVIHQSGNAAMLQARRTGGWFVYGGGGIDDSAAEFGWARLTEAAGKAVFELLYQGELNQIARAARPTPEEPQ